MIYLPISNYCYGKVTLIASYFSTTMLDAAQTRRRGALDFEACYDSACALQDSVPLPAVKANLGQGVLDFCGDRLKLVDWAPILQSLAINKHLHHVAIRSRYQPTSADAGECLEVNSHTSCSP